MKKLNFLLVGHGGVYNRGCEAIIRTTITLINEAFDDPEIVIASHDASSDRLVNWEGNVRFIPPIPVRPLYPDWCGWRRFPLWFFNVIKSYGVNFFLKIPDEVKRADVVLSVGGDNFSTEYNPVYFTNLHDRLTRWNKKIVLWAASVGPFPDGGESKMILRCLSKSHLITVRESLSFEYLKDNGIDAKLTADPAFLLPAEPPPSEKQIQIKKNTLGINLSPFLSWKGVGGGGVETVIESVSQFLLRVIKENDLNILLVPHVMHPDDAWNDFYFMKQLAELLEPSGRVSLMRPDLNAMQTKHVIGQCRFFMGARTHSTIAALSSGVPTLSLAYSVKAYGINRDIFGDDRWVLSVKEVSVESLYEKFRNLFLEESEVRAHLAVRIPEIQKLSKANIKYLVEVLDESQ